MNEEITARIRQALPDSEVQIRIEGNRALIEVVSSAFADMTRVQRHQAVYSCIAQFIASGALHAVTIRTDAG